jgi:hypothetical protein
MQKTPQGDRIIESLRNRWLTALECAQAGGCLSLSQRVGDLRRAGVNVLDRWQRTRGGARVKAYRIAR